MGTEKQIAELKEKMKSYKRKYLRKEFNGIDESGTRIMINSFLTDVLGYKELEEIKTEYRTLIGLEDIGSDVTKSTDRVSTID